MQPARHAESFAWPAATFEWEGALEAAPLVLRKPGFSPSDGETGHGRAELTFEHPTRVCSAQEP
jgi:hypothetical protein